MDGTNLFVALHLLLFLLSSTSAATLNETCPARLSSYNATGTVTVADHTPNTDPAYQARNFFLPPLSNLGELPTYLLYTLTIGTTKPNTSHDGEILSTIFVDVPPTIKLFNDTSSKGLSACAIPILNLPDLTTRYGQDDFGDCLITFPDRCGTDILGIVSETYFNTVASDRTLQGLCKLFADQFHNSLFGAGPNQTSGRQLSEHCTNLFRDSSDGPIVSTIAGYAITSNGSDSSWPFLSSGCNHSESYLAGDSSYPWYSHSIPFSDLNYDKATRAVYPVVTLFFGNLDSMFDEPKIAARAVSMSCLRANYFTLGSRVSPELKSASSKGGGLTHHDIVGIVVGVVAGILWLGMVLGWLYLLRRRHRGGVKRNPFAQPADQVFGRMRPHENSSH